MSTFRNQVQRWPYAGQPQEGEKVVAPIKSLGNPVGGVLVRWPYAQMQSLLDATQPKGRRYYWKSEYLSHVEPELCEKVIEYAARIRSPHSAVILFQIEGASQVGQTLAPSRPWAPTTSCLFWRLRP